MNIIRVLCLVAQGRYTRNIEEYQLAVPHRVSSSGEFITFVLPEYFVHNFAARHKRAEPDATDKIHYKITFDGREHHVELWPNHGILSPNLVTERFDDDAAVQEKQLNRINDKLCHFIGHIKDMPGSSAALSLCDGVAGYLMTDNGQYFIEPVAEHGPNEYGAHMHVVYKRNIHGQSTDAGRLRCGTKDNWEETWTNRLYEQYEKRATTAADVNNMESKQHYMELLIVADRKFLHFHKDITVETYIMTIMNMVSNYFFDNSAGNSIAVTIVRIIYLEKEVEKLDLILSQDAEKTLENFCTWQTTINPTDKSNPQHHDIAVLLTRYDLCSDNITDCSLMGLAYLTAACKPDKACAICEDSGLALGITVTHEVGHVMGCSHDNNEDSPCPPQDTGGEYFLMAPYVHMQTTKWSPCSRKFMTELFENRLGECLNDEPEESLFQESEMLPGAVYDADFQCNLDFPGSTHCYLEHIKVCESLYCLQGTSCVSRGEPPADGTKCGENMWCFNGKCVHIGERPTAVDGGWGEYSEWSECSRTCGGGVQYTERDCDNPVPENRGRYCIGERKRVKLCNTQECKKGSKSFRAIQCSEHDTKPEQNKVHVWTPYEVQGKPCALYCINEEHIYAELAHRVIDGTSCKRGTKNKCIFGVCRIVGCDWELDSNAVEDECGVCNGDGSECKIINSVYDDDGGQGYTKIVQIPAGARNIRVNERKGSENTIAISASDEQTFYLNGNYIEELDGDKDFGGTMGLYEHPEENKESLFIPGPIEKPIILYEIFYKPDNPGVEYSYAEPISGKEKSHQKLVYHWDFLEYGPCSAICGRGVATAKPECMEAKKGRVSEAFCNKLPKPEIKVMECSDRPCETKWRSQGWGRCTGCNGKSGVRVRTVDCIKEANEANVDPIIVADTECVGPKPPTQQVCCSKQTCPQSKREASSPFENEIGKLWHQMNKCVKTAGKKHEVEDNVVDLHDLDIEKVPTHFDETLKNKKIKIYHQHRQYLPPEYLRNLRRNKIIPRQYYWLMKRKCPETAGVLDKIPPEGNKFIKVPIKESHKDVKMSEAAYENAGDKVVDTLDFCHAQVFKGKAADKEFAKSKTKKGPVHITS